MKNCDKHIEKALKMAHELILLADAGDDIRKDVGCGVLFGTLRDCAYKIQTLAQQELLEHRKKQKKHVGEATVLHKIPPQGH